MLGKRVGLGGLRLFRSGAAALGFRAGDLGVDSGVSSLGTSDL